MDHQYDEAQIVAFQQDVIAAYAEAGRQTDLNNVVWSARCTWDARDIGWEASRIKHLAELRAELGLRPRGLRSDIRANFCGAKDGQGRVMFDVFYISLSDADREDWRKQKASAGLTHILLCPNAGYPGSPIPSRDLRGQPAIFAGYVEEVVNAGFFPIIFMTTGDTGTAADMDIYWPNLAAVLQPYQESLIVVPGFEVVGPGGGWTSKELSDSLQLLKQLLPNAMLGVHLQPERASGASNPLESDDPWQGDEPGFWRSHGGELVDVFLYQTGHGSSILSDAWQERWIEVRDRLGVGGHTWKKVPCSFFETVAYDFYHGNCNESRAPIVSGQARDLFEQSETSCTFGNGLP